MQYFNYKASLGATVGFLWASSLAYAAEYNGAYNDEEAFNAALALSLEPSSPRSLRAFGGGVPDATEAGDDEQLAMAIALSKLEIEEKNPVFIPAQPLPALAAAPASEIMLLPFLEKKQRSSLEDDIISFQKQLNGEFERRKNRNDEETVMVYGNSVAKNYYGCLENYINDLWKRLDLKAVPRKEIKNIEDIMALHKEVKEELDHTNGDLAAVQESLETSFNRHKTLPLTLYLGDKTQYQYLLMVSSQAVNFYHIVKDVNKDQAHTLLGIFFNALVEQRGKCQAGMIGRLLTVHKMTLDMLIDYYNAPLP